MPPVPHEPRHAPVPGLPHTPSTQDLITTRATRRREQNDQRRARGFPNVFIPTSFLTPLPVATECARARPLGTEGKTLRACRDSCREGPQRVLGPDGVRVSGEGVLGRRQLQPPPSARTP